MKKLSLLLLLCLFSTAYSLGQNYQKGFVYTLSKNTQLHLSQPGVGTPDLPLKLPKETRVQISQHETISPEKLRVTIKSLNVPNTSGYLGKDDSGELYYVINKRKKFGDVPHTYVALRYRTLSMGALTIPFKYRFGGFTNGDSNIVKNERVPVQPDFSVGINVGYYIGIKWGMTRFYADPKRTHNGWAFLPSLFTTPVLIALSEENTSKQVKTKSNQLGWGFGTGCLFSRGDLEIGLFAGIDVPISGQSKKWDYANKPWVGLGFGYKLGMFNIKDE